jgi:tripeptidyl-peptidase-1
MLDLSVLLTIAKATQAVFGTPIQARTTYAVKGAHPVPRQWTKLGRAPREQMLHLQIGVKQSQFDELERHLYEGMQLYRSHCQAQLLIKFPPSF